MKRTLETTTCVQPTILSSTGASTSARRRRKCHHASPRPSTVPLPAIIINSQRTGDGDVVLVLYENKLHLHSLPEGIRRGSGGGQEGVRRGS
jgi:hypothetical protein